MKTSDEAMVMRPSTMKASWTPWISAVGFDRRLSGTKKAAISDAPATPKLIDICWPVLAIVLAALVSSSVTSAYTSVFMAVYCVQVEKAQMKDWSANLHQR